IDVRHQDVLPPARRPRQDTVPRLDAFDDGLGGAFGVAGHLLGGAEPDAVAGGDDVAFVRGQAAQQPADGAAVLLAVLAFDDADVSIDTQHATRPAFALIDGAHCTRLIRSRLWAGLLLDDRPAARELPLGVDALLLLRGVVLVAVLLVVLRPVAVAGDLIAVLPQIHANLFLLGHAASSAQAWRYSTRPRRPARRS